MKYKKYLFISCLIIFLFSITGIYAIDNSDALQTSDNSTQLLEETEEMEISSSDDDLLATEDDGTFTALQKKIDESDEGSTITLTRDYTYDEGFSTRGIVIDKDLTIDGNGHTINGLSKSRIFIIKLGVIFRNKVTLNNINFVNGNTNLYGGAIFNYGDLKVDDCQFTNNYAKYCGGAINSIGYLECKNSKFSNNIASGDGGAIFTLSIRGTVGNMVEILKDSALDGNMNFISTLKNNFTLIFAKESISNCVFTNNQAKGRGGGAIYAYGNIDIKSSTFTQNTAGEKGGAVFGNKDLFISSSTFTSNQASKYGGAVYFKCHDQGTQIKYYSNLIQTSTFKKNTANKGGAIYAFRYSDDDNIHCAKAMKCTFEANKASKGRDIYGGTASKCVFNYLKLTLKSVKVKKSAKKLVLTATLKKGSPLKGKKVTFKFNGKTYKAKTNKKGIAKVTIKKNVLKKLKIGKKVKYQVKYGKLTVKKTAIVKK